MSHIADVFARARECHEAVTRGGVYAPCGKPAVALRRDPDNGSPYPVCPFHCRGDVVTLTELRTALEESSIGCDGVSVTVVDGDHELRRYATEEDAMRGHLEVIDRLRAGLAPFRAIEPEVFDPPAGREGDADKRLQEAVTLCGACPSLDACREWVDGLPASKKPPGVTAGRIRIPNPAGRPRKDPA